MTDPKTYECVCHDCGCTFEDTVPSRTCSGCFEREDGPYDNDETDNSDGEE